MVESSTNTNISAFIEEINNLNILVLGKIGVGKSTLVNAVFGENTAEVGAGFPVTQYFNKYVLDSENSLPITLYDSAGCELGEENDFVKGVSEFINEQSKKGIDEQIHIIWYVVSASSARFEPYEGVIINNLYDMRVPAIVVLSQCDRADDGEIEGVRKAITSLDLKKVYNIVEVAAKPLKRLNEEPRGLEELVNETVKLLPKILGDAFIARQVVNIKAKRSVAFGYIFVAATACFATGFVPVPFTTPTAALTAQTVLWNRLAKLYSLENVKGLGDLWRKITFSDSAVVTLFATTIADFFAWTGIGGAIAGGTAATFIVIVGAALTETFEELAVKELDGLSREEIETLLQSIFQKYFAKYKGLKIKDKSDLERLREDFLKS